MSYIIKCENGGEPWWISSAVGDPPRTLLLKNARTFDSIESAEKYIRSANKKYPWRNLAERLQIISSL